MKTLDEYYRLILITMAIVVLLPLTTLLAEDYWDWYTYGTGDESPNIYESSQCVTKIVDIEREYLYHYFDEEDGDSFYMISGWYMDIYARVENPEEEAYSNYFELEGEAYHWCEEDWEWTGPPASAPGAAIDFSLYTSGTISSDGGLYIGASKDLGAGTLFSGFIGDVRIYKQALGTDEIAALAQ